MSKNIQSCLTKDVTFEKTFHSMTKRSCNICEKLLAEMKKSLFICDRIYDEEGFRRENY